jgi:hypothetical protein
MDWKFLDPRMTMEHLGYLPQFLDDADPRPAKEQFNERYQWGGWQPFGDWKMAPNGALTYPGDPPLNPLAVTVLRQEVIMFYPHSVVAILQPDGTFEVARLD